MMTTELLRLHVNSLERSLREQRSTAVTEVVQAYNKEIDELMNQKTKIKIEKIDHRNLNVKMSLETASLFDFMIN